MAKHELVFGLHAVQSLLKSAPHRITRIQMLLGRQDMRAQKVSAAAQKADVSVELVERKTLDKLCEGNHQGVLAYVIPGKAVDEAELYKLIAASDMPPLVLVLDGITDPHNLGACLRSADAAGACAVVIPKDNSASLTEVARKVACGAADSVPLIAVTNLARSLKKMQEQGLWVSGLAGEAQQTLYQADLSGARVIVMGAEGRGMRRLTRECCDELINIPMAGSVSSLNVSVATGIALFEVVRQRQM